MLFSSTRLQIFCILTVFFIRSESEEKSFCDSNKLSSVFSIDKDVYLVGTENGRNIFWKYQLNSNHSVIDNHFEALVKRLNFKTNYALYAFKFTQVYECSRDTRKCRNNHYKFEGIDHCTNHLEYCQNLVKFQDIIILIGFNIDGKQSYQALKHDRNGFSVIESTSEMPFSWPPKGELANGALFLPKKDITSNTLIAIIFIRSRYELALIIKSNSVFILKHTSLKQREWFKDHKWNSVDVTNHIKNAIIVGLFESEQKDYAVIDNELYEYKMTGALNFSRTFKKLNMTLKSFFQCQFSASKQVPETHFLGYIMIPSILAILVAISCIASCLWYNPFQNRVQFKSSRKKRISLQKNETNSVLKTPPFPTSDKKTKKNSR